MNILIVDDEPDTREEIVYYVNQYGRFHSCVVCYNALEALDLSIKTPFDIALLDIEMPGMNGMELAERLVHLFPDIRIAFITAYNHYAAEAFEVNALDYILKPVRKERLFKTLDKLGVEKTVENGLLFNMFGKFTAWLGDERVTWKRQKSAELVAYMLENRESPIRKEVLCELFYPDQEPKKALMNLQTIIYSIRKTLGTHPDGRIRIEYGGHHYTLYINDAWVDVDQFEKLLQKARDLKDAALLEQAISLYKGDYLEEDGWLWAEPKKVVLQKKYQFAVQKLSELKKRK